ncbi:hypothetical protein TIFTF001_051944 [Ficus carica]|uniref:Uncharacterized protein n=1 Tax=Ficus carica TaxID=3494 RepID=A0AA88ED01_FICCA|nr:hypothetical protein TIFTF001_051944 [Ficus carica]
MSKSCLLASPALMMPSASSLQSTTSPLSSSPPGFGRNVREDISRMVLTSELKELPPLILSEYFSAKVTVRSKMAILKEI